MSSIPVWPDRVQYADAVQNPQSFFDDPLLQQATFARGRFGMPMAWSGGRAIVFRATRPDGADTAVRFLLTNDHDAETRYLALARHLSAHPVETLVNTRWLGTGLHIGGQDYPVMVMDWVDGCPIDRHIEQCLKSLRATAELRALCDAWLRACRSLSAASIGHGDVHAGNTLIRNRVDGAPEIQLVDYDNVWVPGLPAPCSQEAGHPAFQHPARGSIPNSSQMDAFPNTLTYLCLLALANDPSLWRFHEETDDVLLFHSRDLLRPDTEVWAALRASTDPFVRSLVSLTVKWLGGRAGQYGTLDQVVHAAETQHGVPAFTANVWPPASVTTSPTSWPPRADRPVDQRPAAPVPRQSWPVAEPQHWPTPTPPAPARRRSTGRMLVMVLLIIAALVVIAVLAG